MAGKPSDVRDEQTLEVGIYTRISNADPYTQTATHRQEAACRSFAQARGWSVAEVFEDVDVSAYSGVERPAYERLLKKIDAASLSGVIVWKLDRLVRRPREFERFWDVCERHRAVLASATEPMDSSTDLGLAVVRMLVVMATLESATKGARMRAMWKEQADKGKPPAGARGFGYTRGWQQFVPEEAALIREGADRVLSGETLRRIAEDWRDRGVPSPKGAVWKPDPLRRILLNPRIAGLRAFHKEVVAKGSWPAILDEATFRRVEAVLRDRKYEGMGSKPVGLLTSLMRCGKCRGPFNCGKRPQHKGRVPIYVCRKPPWGCAAVSVAMHRLDPWVMQKIFRYLDSERLRMGLDRHRQAVKETSDVVGLAHALDELALDHYERRLLTARQYEVKRRSLSRRLDHASASINLEVRFSALARLAGRGAEVRERWTSMDIEERRDVAVTAIERITLAPVDRSTSPRFQPRRVRIRWRI
jgi:DNA invertase Pin-like site-specific DNA recombinase